MNNNVVEPICEMSLTKKPWQTPEVIVLASDDTEFGGGLLPDANGTQRLSAGGS